MARGEDRTPAIDTQELQHTRDLSLKRSGYSDVKVSLQSSACSPPGRVGIISVHEGDPGQAPAERSCYPARVLPITLMDGGHEIVPARLLSVVAPPGETDHCFYSVLSGRCLPGSSTVCQRELICAQRGVQPLASGGFWGAVRSHRSTHSGVASEQFSFHGGRRRIKPNLRLQRKIVLPPLPASRRTLPTSSCRFGIRRTTPLFEGNQIGCLSVNPSRVQSCRVRAAQPHKRSPPGRGRGRNPQNAMQHCILLRHEPTGPTLSVHQTLAQTEGLRSSSGPAS
jgi:hypothetical protein